MAQATAKQVESTKAPHQVLIEALYDMYCENGQIIFEHLWLEDAAKIAGIGTWPEIMGAASYLSQKKFIEDFDPALQVYVKLTVRGIEYVEKSRKPISNSERKSTPRSVVIHNHNSPGANFHLGQGDIQQQASWIELANTEIEKAQEAPEQKEKAKSLLKQISENKLVNTAISAVLGAATKHAIEAATHHK
ncbi:MAG: hypothetical protein EPO07_19760 [Verrucomicrobia bacterium]|nr:MAG: hypothetical protein EPO07_19760 [Verrucomicrobiota bacterium]